METGKHEAGLANPVLAKDRLRAGEKGKSNSIPRHTRSIEGPINYSSISRDLLI